MGGNPVKDVIGILIGHLYVFFKDIIPQVYGTRLLNTPEFFYRFFDRQNVAGVNPAWQNAQGYRLG